MKLRFFAGLGFSVVIFIAMIWLTGNSLALYTDPASFIIVILFPHILISFLVPLSEQRKMIHGILSKDETPEKEILGKALSYLKSLKRMIITAAVAATVLGTIGIMVNLENPDTIGPNFAVALIVTFYAAIYILVVIEPLRLTAERKLLQKEA